MCARENGYSSVCIYLGKCLSSFTLLQIHFKMPSLLLQSRTQFSCLLRFFFSEDEWQFSSFVRPVICNWKSNAQEQKVSQSENSIMRYPNRIYSIKTKPFIRLNCDAVECIWWNLINRFVARCWCWCCDGGCWICSLLSCVVCVFIRCDTIRPCDWSIETKKCNSSSRSEVTSTSM